MNATLTRRVEDYLQMWYAQTPEDFEIDWSNVTVDVSGRMTRAFGKASMRRDRMTGDVKDYRIAISKHLIESQPWYQVKATIRHEAIHIWQFQTYGSADHGHTFARWATPFDVDVNAPCAAKEGKYLIECASCGMTDSRQTRSKIIKHPEQYSCKCGGSISVRTM